MNQPAFTKNLLSWYKTNGRKNLPWQENRNSYRVWISEIMLQQTQVKTVIPYYLRFLNRFPHVISLANAPLDEVLALWAGLGYYSRARHLHRTAIIIRDQFQGHFPDNLCDMMKLPGIGRSTASAILAFSQNKAYPILDGNVKRVLTRVHAIPEWPGQKKTEEKLWQLAEKYTPDETYIVDYTQAIMDLGATICTRSSPKCEYCPVSNHCLAYLNKETKLYPASSPKKNIPTKKIYFIVLINEKKEILLERRPEIGIWGGLWSFPESDSENIPFSLLQQLSIKNIDSVKALPIIKHTFSHYKLMAQPICYFVSKITAFSMSEDLYLWHNPRSNLLKGVPTPIKKCLELL